MKYDVFLLDADDTLLDFGRAAREALDHTLQKHGLPVGEPTRRAYLEINDRVWRLLEQGRLTRKELQTQRFHELFEVLGVTGDAVAVNRDYMEALGGGGFPLPGAREFCEALCLYGTSYIVTNGSKSAQDRRLAASGLLPFIRKVYISEEIGFQKPRREFFDAVLCDIEAEQGSIDPARVIVLGDSLTSDMQGGRNAGLATCWYNPAGLPPGEAETDYTVSNYDEFIRIVENKR